LSYTDNTMKNTNKKRNVLLAIVFLLLMIFATAYIYVNHYLLPIKLKDKAVGQLAKLTKRQVSLDKLSYIPFKGVVLSGIKISSLPVSADTKAPGEDNRDFIAVKELCFNILFINLIRGKNIVIPDLKINGLYLNLQRTKDGSFNVAEFINDLKKVKQETPSNKKSKYSFFLKKVGLYNSVIDFTDNSLAKPFSRKLTRLNIGAAISMPEFSANLTGSGKLSETETFRIKGRYQALSNDFSMQLNLQDLDIAPYLNAYAASLPVDIGRPNADIELNFETDLKTNKKIKVSTVCSFKKCRLNWQDYKLEGDIDFSADTQTSWPLPNDWKTSVPYEIEANLIKNTFSLPGQTSSPGETISGWVTFTPDNLEFKNIKIFRSGASVFLAGHINNFKNPQLNLSVNSTADLYDITKLVPEKISNKMPVMRGKSSVALKISGPAKDLSKLALEGTINLDNCTVKYPAVPAPIEKIKGSIKLSKDSFSTSNFKFTYNQSDYKLNLNCANLSNLVVDAKLISKDLSLETTAQIVENSLTISKLKSRFHTSNLSINGNIKNIKNLSSSLIDIQAVTSLELSDLEKVCQSLGFTTPAAIQKLNELSVNGRLDSEFSLYGSLSERGTWQIKPKTGTPLFKIPRLKIKDYNIENIHCLAAMQKGVLEITSLQANGYEGILQNKAIIDFNPDNFAYQTSISLANLDLHKLIKVSQPKKKEIYGILDTQLKLGGYGKDLSTLKGKGIISSKDGKLEIPILESIASFMKLPFLGKFTFNSIQGQFNIANQAIIIPEIQLLGKEADLLCKGTVGFDQKLDIIVEIHMLKESYNQNQATDKVGNIIMGPLGKYITRVRVRGTIKEPKISWAPIRIDEFIKDTVKDLIDIFSPSSE